MKAECIILNRNFPPDPGITGHSAADLANFLIERGHRVGVASISGKYAGGVMQQAAQHGIPHQKLRAIYNGKQKHLRLLSSICEGRALASKPAGAGAGVTIAMTDPPLLNYWAAQASMRTGIPWICWSMDLYPDAFVAAELTKRDNVLVRHIKTTLKRQPPVHLIALGPKQAAYLTETLGWDCSTSILPCGIHEQVKKTSPPDWRTDAGDKLLFGYIGNLGEAHQAEFVLEVIRCLDHTKHSMVLSTYGVGATRLLEEAAKNPAVRILENVDRSDLGWVDVHLVSLKPAWDHICVPSKAVSAVCSGSCILLCGSPLNDTWGLLGEAGWRVDPDELGSEKVAHLIADITNCDMKRMRGNASNVAARLLQTRMTAYNEIELVVRGIFQRKSIGW